MTIAPVRLTLPAMFKYTLALCGLLFVTGCGEAGSYELSWNIGCDKATACNACSMQNALDCSKVGLDSILVQVQRGGLEETSSTFPCYSVQDGALGRGPGLDTGKVTLEVTGLSPGDLELTDSVTIDVTIPETGLVSGCVKLPAPVACADGVDNDGDGLVDGHDPDCTDNKDTDEA